MEEKRKTIKKYYPLTFHLKLSEKYTVNQDGKKDGLYEEFNFSGKRTTAENYSNGILNGESIRIVGKFLFKSVYQNGNLLTSTIYKNDKIFSIRRYKDGKLNGYQEDFHPNGQIKSIKYFKDGRQSGTSKQWQPNGLLEEEANYQDGYLNGSFILYDKKGNIIQEGVYEKDIFTGKKKNPIYDCFDFFINGKETPKQTYDYIINKTSQKSDLSSEEEKILADFYVERRQLKGRLSNIEKEIKDLEKIKNETLRQLNTPYYTKRLKEVLALRKKRNEERQRS